MTTSDVRPGPLASPDTLSPAARRLLEQRLRGHSAVRDTGPAPVRPRPDRIPLSAAQQRLYFLDRLDPDLTERYRARTEGRAARLPELPLDDSDYAIWQRESDQSAALDHWRTRLAGLTPLDLPTDHPRPDTPGSLGATHPLSLPPD